MKAEIVRAIARLSVLKFFPPDGPARTELMRFFERMVSTPQQLNWLVNSLIDRVGEYPGTAEIRGLFCTRFKPKDGIEVCCTLPGFRAEDMEGRLALEGSKHKAALEGREQLAISGAVERMPEQELARFHNEILSPLASRSMPGTTSDRASIRSAEAEIARCRPTLTPEEKQRRTTEIERALGRGVRSPEPSYSTSNVRR